MKKLIQLIALLFASAAFAETPVNTKCPVSGKDVDKAQTTTYKKEIKFCCENCKAKFDKDPDAMAEKIAKYDSASDKCIVSGKAADAAQKSTYERTVASCCEKCKAKVDAKPDDYIAKAVKK